MLMTGSFRYDTPRSTPAVLGADVFDPVKSMANVRNL